MRPPLGPAAVAVLLAIAALATGVLVGHATARPTGAAAPVTLVDGIPVGVAETPAGALAAADNYLAIGSQSVEQDPALFTRLVNVAYAPSARAAALAQAATLRRIDTPLIANYAAGGRAVAVIAARRLDHFTPARASVTSWLGGFVWGPHLAPRQSWNLVTTALEFAHGRWLVVSSVASSTPAPVPSVVFVDGRNNLAGSFDERLAGMSAPFYGTG